MQSRLTGKVSSAFISMTTLTTYLCVDCRSQFRSRIKFFLGVIYCSGFQANRGGVCDNCFFQRPQILQNQIGGWFPVRLKILGVGVSMYAYMSLLCLGVFVVLLFLYFATKAGQSNMDTVYVRMFSFRKFHLYVVLFIQQDIIKHNHKTHPFHCEFHCCCAPPGRWITGSPGGKFILG